MDALTVDWTALPLQLYPSITERLKTHIELLRFRSACSSWRSSIPPFQASIPPTFPFPTSNGPNAFLSQATVYLLRPYPHPDPSTLSLSSSSSATSSCKGWLLKVEECADKLRLLDPINSWRIRSLLDDVPVSPADFNLLDFNMVELTKAPVLRYTKGAGSIFGINKVIVAPNFKDYSVFIIYNDGKLGFAQIGDEKLTLINDQISDYNDIIVYKGQPCVVDRWGQIFSIDSSLKLEPFSHPIGFGHRKSLIECCGELYVVDRYLDDQVPHSKEDGLGSTTVHFDFLQRRRPRRRGFFDANQPNAIDFRVYKLLDDDDEELGRRWVEVESLGDHAFFLSIDCCFSVLASKLEGCKGNCIYFSNSNDIGLALRESIRPDGSVFSLEDHSIERLGSSTVYSKMFWRLPA